MKELIARHRRMVIFNTSKLDQLERLALAGFGLVGEYGEALTAVGQKDKELEVGDYLWYVHLMCIELEIDFNLLLARASHNDWSEELEGYKQLSLIAEYCKKTAITKQKPFTLDVATEIEKLLRRPTHTMYMKLSPGVEFEEALIKNIEKLEARHKREYK